MQKFKLLLLAIIVTSCLSEQKSDNKIFQHQEGVTTKWISFENPTGEKGNSGKRNKGAKGAAFYPLKPGEVKTIMDFKGTGIINRMWMTGTFIHNPRGRRGVVIEIYWDGESKPAVSAPIHDFYGMGLAMKRPFESELFSQPEGRSYNSFVQMPFRKGAKIIIRNETKDNHMFYFDVNLSEMKELPKNSLYFHAYWHRQLKTELKKDFEILPKIEGKGRFLGTNIGVICDTIYRDTWFGEGEVKIYMDGDKEYPTLCGTGTEDYIGTGWGQEPYTNMRQGCPVGDKHKGLYAFYRYHTVDPVFFNRDCRVTIQQMGNDYYDKIISIIKAGAEMEVISVFEPKEYKFYRINEGDCVSDPMDPKFPKGWTCFWRRDDVCATAYFYLDKPSSNLPKIQDYKIRTARSERLK